MQRPSPPPDPRTMTNEEWLEFRADLERRAGAERERTQRAAWHRLASWLRGFAAACKRRPVCPSHFDQWLGAATSVDRRDLPW